MANLAIGTWKEEYAADLAARPGLNGVTVYDAEETAVEVDREHIILGDWTSDMRRLTFGVTEEVATVECTIIINKPNSAKAARDRAVALLDECRQQLLTDPESSSSVWDTEFVRYEVEETPYAENGRKCELSFFVEVTTNDQP